VMPATKEKMLFNTLAHCQRITSQVGKGTGVSDCGNQAGQGNPRLWMSSERRVGEATGSLLEATEPDALGQSRAEPSKKFVELLGTTHSRFVYSTRVQVANVFRSPQGSTQVVNQICPSESSQSLVKGRAFAPN
jgi:hypothetical protein